MILNEAKLKLFKESLIEKKIRLQFIEKKYVFKHGEKKIELNIPDDLIFSSHKKLVSVITSRLLLNERVFARKCEVKRISKEAAEKFLNEYHLMNSATCAFAFALFLKEELLAVATFSKGRKMDRLADDKRSFELIRFCCKDGITITGGLSRLVKTFGKQKGAGDVMTYLDPKFSLGESYLKAGFKKLESVKESENKHNNIKLVYTVE